MNFAVRSHRAVAAPAVIRFLTAAAADLLARWPVRKRRAGRRGAVKATPARQRELPSGIRRLALLGNAMQARCRTSRQPLSLLVFEFCELREVQALFGRRAIAAMGLAIASKLQDISPTRAVVVRTSTTRFAVLLPAFDAATARRAVTSALGKACCLDFDVGDREMLLVPEYALRSLHRDEECVDAVYQRLCLELLTARQIELQRTDYLTRERESHTRPPRPAAEQDSTVTAARSSAAP